jgi:hypothetical protein
MQDILTVEEVVERIRKAGSAPRQPQVFHSPKLRPEYQPHRAAFYVPMLTRRLVNLDVQHVSRFHWPLPALGASLAASRFGP